MKIKITSLMVAFLLIISTVSDAVLAQNVQASEEKYVTQNIYRQVTFENEVPGTLAAKDNTLEVTNEESNNKSLLFERTGSEDFHWDLPTRVYESEVLCYQFDVKLQSYSSQFSFYFRDTDGNIAQPLEFQKYCKIQAANGKSKYLSRNKWYTITVMYDRFDGLCHVYVDGSELASDMPVDFDYKKIMLVRWHVKGSASDEKFLIDNFAIYGGTEVNLKAATEERDFAIDTSGKKSIFPSETPQINPLYKLFQKMCKQITNIFSK